MRKISLILAFLFFTFMYANAQYRPDRMDFSTEMYYSPGGATDGQFTLPDYGAKLRMFLSDRMAFTINLGINSTSTSEHYVYEYNSVSPGNTATQAISQDWTDKTSDFTMTLMPGVEYHFTRYYRVSPYFGASVLLGYGTTKTISSNTSNNYDYQNYSKTTTPVLSLGWMLTTGIDIYLCKGLYTGFEFGLGYEYDKTGKQKTVTISGTTTTEQTTNTFTTTSTFGFFATPSLRIGWFF